MPRLNHIHLCQVIYFCFLQIFKKDTFLGENMHKIKRNSPETDMNL
jgi:hypothetical protein